ncbi:MAG: hypothetical protein COB85_01855 [Bacteroidetes bacterium]|nr:MAG: hypothetical protein COB85_01855 [Bacteroidota bacterium]
MRYYLSRILTILFLLLTAIQFVDAQSSPLLTGAQSKLQSPVLWMAAGAQAANVNKLQRYTIPASYKLYTLNIDELKFALRGASHRGVGAHPNYVYIDFPNSSGVLQKFKVLESSIMHPDLAVKYPGIKTYVAQGIDDPTAYMRFSITKFGLHCFTLSGTGPACYIDPYTNDRKKYIVYDRSSISKDPLNFQCLMGNVQPPPAMKTNGGQPKTSSANDQIFRTYRLALSCTAEYGNYFANTGTELADIMAAMTVTMNRVNGVYEIDFSVTLQFVPNMDTIIYWGSTSADPWSTEWNNTTQQVIDDQIGDGNYDIGHNFNTTGGGNAGCISCVCVSGSKGSGYTGGSNPVGDPFDIDYVAHEMGHQFGGYHTMNTCSRSGSGSTEVEPASGSSIMGYAGICGTNVQNFSDAHFNYVNSRDITQNIQTGNSTCGIQTSLSNNPPVASAGANYTIPQGTAFVLEGSATDADGMGSLTYNWSQNDPEQAPSNGSPQSTWTQGPLYRAKLPIVSMDRYMPQITDIIAGNLFPTWEVTPTVGRSMEFSFVVRDNDVSGPQTHDDIMQVTVIGSAGPFVVTSQNTATTWNAGATETITWDVASTSGGSVNTANVDIFLSTDGGFTYSITIVAATSNNGSATITVPTGAATTTGRIMVRGSGNIFFDINDADLTIVEADFAMSFSSSTVDVCPTDTAVYSFTYNTFLGFNETTTFSATGQPVGTTVAFTPATAVSDGTAVQMTITGITGAMTGTYSITVTGTSTSATKTVMITLNVLDGAPSAVTLTYPADGASGVSVLTAFDWTAVAGSDIMYDIEIATDAGFAAVVDSDIGLTTNSFISSALISVTEYFWHVTVYNLCGTASASTTFSFTTSNCNTLMSTDVPVAITSMGTPTITSNLTISLTDTIVDVNVVSLMGPHTWIEDLTFTLQSPSGTSVILIDQICGNQNNFDVNLDDQATPGALPCPPVGGGTYQPLGSLASFNGEIPTGTWVLTVADNVGSDGGSLDSWGLEICTTLPPACIDPDVPTVVTTMDTVCEGNSVTLTASGSLNSATVWQWYTGSCGGTSIGSGNSIVVSPTANTIYYLRGEGGCITPGNCANLGIVVKTGSSTSEAASICNGDTYTFPDGSTSTTATTYTSTLSGANGCDSLVATTLTVDFGSTDSVTASICDGSIFTFPDGSSDSVATTQTSVLSGAAGCDSVIVTSLSINLVYSISENASICGGVTYTFPDGSTSAVATVHTSTLSTMDGCDSLIVTTLTDDSAYYTTEEVSICSGATHTYPDGATSTVTEAHVSVLTSIGGCDSNVTTNLTVDPTIMVNQSADICIGDTYTFPDGTTGNSDTVQSSFFTTNMGCDSVITTSLSVHESYATSESASMCDGDFYVFPDGVVSTVANVHISNITSVYGCDSTVTTSLSITSLDVSVTQVTNVLTVAANDTYQWMDCTNNAIIGATGQSFTVTVDGGYKVALTLDGCVDTSVCVDVVLSGILYNEFDYSLLVYPNPVSDYITIEFGEVYELVSVSVMNLTGQTLIYQEFNEAQKLNLSFENLASGLYLVRAEADGKKALLRIFKD